MVSDKNLNKFIDKLHLRSSNKIWRHVVKEYGERTEGPEGQSPVEDVIPISYVRGKYPQMETKLEKEFIKRMEE